MLRNKIGPVFNARNGSFVFVYFYFSFFCKIIFFLQGERDFQKKKKNLDQFLTLEKAKITLQHIYIYIYAVKLKTGPIFALFKVKNWSIFYF